MLNCAVGGLSVSGVRARLNRTGTPHAAVAAAAKECWREVNGLGEKGLGEGNMANDKNSTEQARQPCLISHWSKYHP